MRTLKIPAPSKDNPVAAAQTPLQLIVPGCPVTLLVRFVIIFVVPSDALNGLVFPVGNAPIASTKPKLNPMKIMKTQAPIHRLLNVFILSYSYGDPYIPLSRIIIRIPINKTRTGKKPAANAFQMVGNPM